VTSGFFFAAASVQHNALLQRQMRFITLALIEIFSLLVSAAIGLAMAALGFGYWALVGWSVALPVAACLGTVIAGGWLPQLPSRDVSVRPLLRFGGLATLNLFVAQVTFNLDKVLVGRYWGAEILGFYGRANQLTGMATNNLLDPIGGVTFAALSRTQGDSIFLESLFLKGYKLVVTVALPITVACVLFSEDIVVVLLGPNWAEVAPVLRLAGPLITIFALTHPTGWFLYALGRVGRALKVGLVILPVAAIGLIAGLPYGASGVAAGYTLAMALLVFPILVWCTRETSLSAWSMLRVVKIPAAAALVAAAAAYGAHLAMDFLAPLPRLLAEGTVLSLTYILVVLWTRDERAFYMGLLGSLRAGSVEIDTPRPGIV
jgi:PST family polysaccharide transporter